MIREGLNRLRGALATTQLGDYVFPVAQLREARRRELIAQENCDRAINALAGADLRMQSWQATFEKVTDKLKSSFVYDHARPSVAVDCVLIAQDSVLLIRRRDEPFKGAWALPGGYMEIGETLEAAASRELKEETGIGLIEWRRVGVYDAPNRDPRGRVISVAFCSHLSQTLEPVAGDDAVEARWVPLREAFRTELAFDHRSIVLDSISRGWRI